MEEKNWLKDLVNSSDFEYFDGEEDEDYEDYEGDDDYEEATGSRRRRMRKVRRANIKKPLGQGNKSVPFLQASPNPFTIQESYNAISTLNFDLLVEATKAGSDRLSQLEIPILYPYMAYWAGGADGDFAPWLQRYGIMTKGSFITLKNAPIIHQHISMGKLNIRISGMSFNITDLYNAILHRNIKLQINKMRFALQEPDDVAYLDALTMYSIGITSKVQKDSLNAGSFVKPQNFNTNIVDVDMKIIVDYNSILTYNYNPAMISADPTTGDGKNTFRMSFFCNILK